MKALLVARKTLLELLREPQLSLMVLAFPPLLVTLYYLAFGSSAGAMADLVTVLFCDAERSRPGGAGREVRRALEAVALDGKPALTVVEVEDRRAGLRLLGERRVAAMVEVPEGFTEALASAGPGRPRPVTLGLVGDEGDYTFVLARGFVEVALGDLASARGVAPPKSGVAMTFLPGTGTMADLDFGVPGVLVFGIFFGVISSATLLVRESVGRTLRRLQLTRLSPAELLGGVVLAQLVLALAQLALTFGVAVGFGFQARGSLLSATVVGLVTSVISTGFGLLVASVARSDGEAGNLGAAVAVPMALLSGALFELPAAPIGTVLGRTIQIYDLLPARPATEAMRQVLSYGRSAGELSVELGMLVGFAALVFGAGVLAFGRTRMQAGR